MRYTFDDATADARHTTEYFELTGARAIYHDGWWDGTRHGLDGVTVVAADIVPFDEDVCELYDMRTDFGHAHDLAAEHPDRLAELQALFDVEARSHNVYPLANDCNEIDTAYNRLGRERYTIRSPDPLPTGKCTIRLDFAYDGGGPGKGGTATLTVNGRNVAEGRIDKTVPVYFSTDDTFDVGEDWGTPMAPTYDPPFTFTGDLKKVTVQAK
jgi:ubiquitin